MLKKIAVVLLPFLLILGVGAGGAGAASYWINGHRLKAGTVEYGAMSATAREKLRGLQGPVGNTGATGATGAQGPAGADGTDGADGAPGQVGPQGPAGFNGARIMWSTFPSNTGEVITRCGAGDVALNAGVSNLHVVNPDAELWESQSLAAYDSNNIYPTTGDGSIDGWRTYIKGTVLDGADWQVWTLCAHKS